MASREQIERALANYPKWRGQTIAHLNMLVALWADVCASTLPEKITQAAYKNLLLENTDYRNAFKGLWENPVADYWEYASDASEDLLTRECLVHRLTITTENLERVWPTVKSRLSRGPQYDIAQRQAAQAAQEQRAQEARKKLRELLLQDFVENFEAKHRRSGDIQSLRNVGGARGREEARLAQLTAEQLIAESEKLTTKFAQKAETDRLLKAPLSEVQRTVREQASVQPRSQAPRQSYAPAPGQQFKPLPSDYNGSPWTVKTLERAPDLRRLLREYGPDQINEAVALNKSKGVV